MYEKRQVNYQDIMYLFAGKTIYGCEGALLITSGKVSDDAKRIAEKLDVKIIQDWSPLETGNSRSSNNEMIYDGMGQKVVAA